MNSLPELLSFFDSFTAKMRETIQNKNQDYAGSAASDPFANFTRVKALGICEPEIGFLTRMTDKLSRLASLLTTGKQAVADESVTDTLQDLAAYSILLAAYLNRDKASPGQVMAPAGMRAEQTVLGTVLVPDRPSRRCNGCGEVLSELNKSTTCLSCRFTAFRK